MTLCRPPSDSCQTNIDDCANRGHCQRCFRHVCRADDPAGRACAKYALLRSHRKAGIEGQHLAVRKHAFKAANAGADLTLPGKKDERVTIVSGQPICLPDRFNHCSADGVRAFQINRRRRVRDLDREGPSRYFDHGHAAEVFGEPLSVDRRRCNDQSQFRPPDQEAVDHPKQKVDVDAAFMRFIENHRVVPFEPWISPQMREQHAIGHDCDERSSAPRPIKPHLVADDSPGFRIEFGGDAGGNRSGSNASRLGMGDRAEHPPPCLKAVSRKLRRLS